MSNSLIVMEGSSFFVSDRRGDALSRAAEGLFVADVRHLSTWQLLLDGEPMFLLSSRTLRHDTARVFGTLPEDAHMRHSTRLTVSRERHVSQGIIERLEVESHSPRKESLDIDLRFAGDFIDIFEARRDLKERHGAGVSVSTDEDGAIVLCHEHEGFTRSTRLTCDRGFDLVEDDRLRFRLELAPRQRWTATLRLSCSGDGIEGAEGSSHSSDVGDARERPPVLETEREHLALSYLQSIEDLEALRLPPIDRDAAGVPAAGLPWFMTVFGRDSLITAYQALPFLPRLAAATLRSLAALQAEEDDGFRDAEPGKIMHELRRGKLAFLRKIPHTPYYGTHDATPLFLILLDEYEKWTGDGALIRELEAPARNALRWIETHGDLDGDGYLEYSRRSSLGLENQCWKDSSEAMMFSDGTRADGPLAVCEIQGYAYDARLRAARLARLHWDDDGIADRLESDAADLKERFDQDFWSQARGHYVLALDGRKQQVDALTSNTGHLLWSGIVPEERAEAVAERLLGPDMYNGWGLRTMSSRDGGYNPIGYHIGTVWPHDTGICAEGMRRYGLAEDASRLVLSLLDAAAYFGHRLPEVFAGFDRARTGMPVEYPTASRPQAWAAGAILLALRTLLGLDVVDGELRSSPVLPSSLQRLGLRDVPVRQERKAAP